MLSNSQTLESMESTERTESHDSLTQNVTVNISLSFPIKTYIHYRMRLNSSNGKNSGG